MESDFDFCARRAAEEFVAANRAATPEQRKLHRQLAEQYADLVRAMMLSRTRPADEEQVAASDNGPIVPADGVQAA